MTWQAIVGTGQDEGGISWTTRLERRLRDLGYKFVVILCNISVPQVPR